MLGGETKLGSGCLAAACSAAKVFNSSSGGDQSSWPRHSEQADGCGAERVEAAGRSALRGGRWRAVASFASVQNCVFKATV